VPPRKERISVVLDTNVVVSFFLSRNLLSAAARIFKLWFKQRKLQLIVSDEIIVEYVEILLRLGVSEKRVELFSEVLQKRVTVTCINLGARPVISRDPDDNVFLATAMAGNAKFLVTNDKDLLDVPASQRKKFRFEIVTPGELLARLEK
jgi:putative PIN family toxin of toxin-antitoxin system